MVKDKLKSIFISLLYIVGILFMLVFLFGFISVFIQGIFIYINS